MQCLGDFTDVNGQGGESIYGKQFDDESFEGTAGTHCKGKVCFLDASVSDKLFCRVHINGKLWC